MKSVFYSIAFALSLLATAANAQTESNFVTSLPQAVELNPAQTLKPNGYFSIFPLGGLSMDFSNSGFSFNDVFSPNENGLLVFTPDTLLNSLKTENLYRSDIRTSLMALGFRLNDKFYLHAAVQDVVSVRCRYGDDLFKFILEGNGAHLGETMNLGDINLNASHYADASVGFTWQQKKWSIGVRGHFLYGLNHVETSDAQLNLTTDPETFSIDGNVHLKIKTANASDEFIQSLESGAGQYLLQQKNTGWAGDIGIMCQPGNHFQIGGAVKNIGFIHWKTGVENYEIGPSEIHFNGIDVSDWVATPDEDVSNAQNLVDSLKSQFEVKKDETSYYSTLIPNANFSLAYSLNSKIEFGAQAQAEQFDGKIRAMYTIFSSLQPTRWFAIMPSCSYDWNNQFIAGAGMVLRVGGVQFHASTSNILTCINPKAVQSAQVSVGINFLFGSHK